VNQYSDQQLHTLGLLEQLRAKPTPYNLAVAEWCVMFNRQTLFIVGAGASAEVDFPVGTQLARTIGAKMDIRFKHGFEPVGTGDHDLYSHLVHSKPQEEDQLFKAAGRIGQGLPFAQSIDDFLDQHRTDRYVNLYGKAAIVQAVVEAEHNSHLFFNRLEGAETFDAEKLTDTWFTKFMYMLCRGVPRENVSKVFEKVAFIVFNYDRCIEHFLIHALQRAYSIRFEDAAALVGKLHIVHPYGSVGDLSKVPFGNTRINCVELAKGIKTYTEQADAKDVTEKISSEVERAECMIFLGFAYHNQNLQILRPASRTSGKLIYGTALGMSNSDVSVIQQQLTPLFGPTGLYIDNLTCAGLFENYAKSLTGGD
jgi:hypothetical protein